MSSKPTIKILDQKTCMQAAYNNFWLNQPGIKITNNGENITLSPFSLTFFEF
jgi:hypothetical protein